jgi:hypothetical protein
LCELQKIAVGNEKCRQQAGCGRELVLTHSSLVGD